MASPPTASTTARASRTPLDSSTRGFLTSPVDVDAVAAAEVDGHHRLAGAAQHLRRGAADLAAPGDHERTAGGSRTRHARVAEARHVLVGAGDDEDDVGVDHGVGLERRLELAVSPLADHGDAGAPRDVVAAQRLAEERAARADLDLAHDQTCGRAPARPRCAG